MAIYHFSAKVISRANGSSALASAAYRSASRLYDQRLDRHHDFTNKSGVVHSEVMTPDSAPEDFRERDRLWNAVEAAEKRKDAQLAREVEFAIPREMDWAQGIELARDFVQREFVARGMIADLNVHWDIDEDGQPKPHAHVMLTLRSVDEQGFGAKVRDWNRVDLLEHWRQAWGVHVNERLAELGIEARIDHRSLEDQGINLEPQHKIGRAARSRAADGLEADRLDEHREIARENGERIIRSPAIALDAITRQQATFTERDLAMFVHRHSDGLEQFNTVMHAVQRSPDLVRLGRDGRDEDRFTSREMIAVEERLHRAAELMAERARHRVRESSVSHALERAKSDGLILSREQRAAFAHVTDPRDLRIVVGYAGAGKSALLGIAREAWEDSGFRVSGIALSGIAAENLEAGSGIASRTIASLEHQWAQGRETLSAKDVLVIDEAGMVGSRQLERVLSEAERRGAKVVLVGDPEQLQAIEAGAAFRSITERAPHVEITEVRRQRDGWQQNATRELATGRTAEALDAYRDHGMVNVADTRDRARSELIDGWDRDRAEAPGKTRIILTHTNNEVRALNELARGRLKERGELGEDIKIHVERGARDFAAGDRIMFLKNDRGLGIKNGSLGVVETVNSKHMEVRLDSGRIVGFDLKDYANLDHGYAATIHKAQGVTIDRVHLLATPGLDRHAAYVALSRHRESVALHYGHDDFADDARLARVLSRDRAKDMASDYAREDRAPDHPKPEHSPEPHRTRSIFTGFHPNPVAREPMVVDAASERVPELQQAVRRYARSVVDIAKMEELDLPVLPHQVHARDRAGVALDVIRPHASADLGNAFARDLSLAEDAALGKTRAAIRAMQMETEIRTNPELRADRFVTRWQSLDRQRIRFDRNGDWQGERNVRGAMADLAKSLHRDPQLESILHSRRRELNISMERGPSIGGNLLEYLGLGRNRGLSL
ncbi:MAG: Ti-type conjugative transfer relaxase TraA [Proteobacteria bacterium]|nr:Ti-type conjugative transfer relaxase TraA [Pseudomonadota bacterium]